MMPPVEFLNSLAQAIATMRLYGETHAARRRAVDRAYDALLDLLKANPNPAFSFLEDEVIFANERLRELGPWKWGRELARTGVERVEIQTGVPRDEFERFLTVVRERVDRGNAREDPIPFAEVRAAFPHIRFGQLSIEPSDASGGWYRPGAPDLKEETEATGWLLGEGGRKARVSAAVTDAVVRSLARALHEEHDVFRLLLPLRETDEYTTIHSMNVAILSMAVAESIGHGGPFVKAIGEAALLHDVGKTRVPAEILQKPRGLSPEEWRVMQKHPEDGARILLNSRADIELAAIVAYEHHATWNGGGYPKLQRRPHPVSQLVQLCDIYDALRTQRPFRGPWEPERIAEHLRTGAGLAHDPQAVSVFLEMLAQWSAAAPEGNGSGPGHPTAH
ncbi:MAG: HD domain-containing protein [Gemmatimonadetes bacterium]|nr:HD domain-containing protein [Gemmatimonadota bacterium]